MATPGSSIDHEITLAQLVIGRPELGPYLDRLGLDYCCGGQRTLATAVVAAGLDLSAVVAGLEATEPRPEDQVDPWAGVTPSGAVDLTGLVDHLEATHHAYLRRTLPPLIDLADKVADVHGANHPELAGVAALVGEIRADLEPHLLKEERVLFPMVRELSTATAAPSFHCGSLQNPISVMLAEHDSVGDLLRRLRSQTVGYRVPDDGCPSYHALYAGLAELEADTHRHVHEENNILFPAVVEAEAALTGR